MERLSLVVTGALMSAFVLAGCANMSTIGEMVNPGYRAQGYPHPN